MLKRRVIIPMASIMALSSSISAFASEAEPKANEQENYKELVYQSAKVTPNNGLNIRETPEVKDGNKITAVSKGTEIEILGQVNDWYKVELAEKESAWINSNYVDVLNESLYITGDKVNFREGSSLESNIYKVLPIGTKVEFVEAQNDWIKVKYEDKEGYIYNKYISDEKPEIKEENKQEVNRSSNIASAAIEQSNNNENMQETEQQTNSSENQQSTNNQSEISNEQANNQQSNDSKEESNSSSSDTNKQSSVVNLAYAQLGKPYVWGAEGPSSFDCSGLMQYIFKNGAGVNLPRTSKQQSNFGTTVDKSQLQPGDLIFSSTDGSGGVSHVGVYVGNGEMIHAPQSGDVVKKSSINTSYWNNAYLWSKRVL